MNSIASDTHAAANRLRRAGFTEDQAQALVEMARETTARPDASTVATTSDIARLEQLMTSGMERLQLAARADGERLGRLTQAAIERLEQAMRTELSRLEGVTKSHTETVGFKVQTQFAKIGLQVIFAVLSGTVLIVILALPFVRLFR